MYELRGILLWSGVQVNFFYAAVPRSGARLVWRLSKEANRLSQKPSASKWIDSTASYLRRALLVLFRIHFEVYVVQKIEG